MKAQKLILTQIDVNCNNNENMQLVELNQFL